EIAAGTVVARGRDGQFGRRVLAKKRGETMTRWIQTLVVVVGAAAGVSAQSSNGIGGIMPAYYDDQLFTINFKELPPGGEGSNLQHNGSINTIYQSDGCMPGGEMFVSVLDAIQGDGFNPLWQEVQVIFDNPTSFPCQQLTSDT